MYYKKRQATILYIAEKLLNQLPIEELDVLLRFGDVGCTQDVKAFLCRTVVCEKILKETQMELLVSFYTARNLIRDALNYLKNRIESEEGSLIPRDRLKLLNKYYPNPPETSRIRIHYTKEEQEVLRKREEFYQNLIKHDPMVDYFLILLFFFIAMFIVIFLGFPF